MASKHGDPALEANPANYAAYTRRLQHSFAYLVRKRDAEVGFNLRPFVQEFVYNLLSSLSLPLIIAVHGRFGARNRQFLGISQNTFWAQVANLVIFIAVNGMFMLYYGKPGFDVSIFELASINILNLLRVATIAVKYSTFTRAELCEMDARDIPYELRWEKLLLGGWSNPTPHLIMLEMERAITRTCPHLARHSIAFPDVETRDAVLYQMIESLPAFNKLELCDNIRAELGLQADDSCPACARSMADPENDPVKAFLQHISPVAVAQPEVEFAPSPTVVTAVAQPLSPIAEVPGPRLPATASRRYSGPFNAGTASSRRPSRPADPNIGSDMLLVSPSDAGAQAYVKAHLPAPVLPTIPAKLFLFHVLYQSHCKFDSGPYFAVLPWIILVFVSIPFIIRAGTGAFLTMQVPGIIALVLLAEQGVFYLMTTASFVLIGALDMSRRLAAGVALLRMLDSNALIALRMHDSGDVDAEEGSTLAHVPVTSSSLHKLALPRETEHGKPGAFVSSKQLAGGESGSEEHDVETIVARDVPTNGVSSRVMAVLTKRRSATDPPSNGRTMEASETRPPNPDTAETVVESEGMRRRRATAQLNHIVHALRVVHSRPRQEFRHMDLHPQADDDAFAPVLSRMLEYKKLTDPQSPSSPGFSGSSSMLRNSKASVTPVTQQTPQPPVVVHTESQADATGSTLTIAVPDEPGRTERRSTSSASKVPVATCKGNAAPCQHADCPVCGHVSPRDAEPSLERSALPAVGRRVRNSIVSRHMLLPPADIEKYILQPSTNRVSLPLMYPQNILAWMHVRNAVGDFGRSYQFRIMTFTTFFATFVLAAVVFLFFITNQSQQWGRLTEMYVVVTIAGYEQLVFGSLLTFQVIQGSRVNRINLAHQRRLNKIESLTFEYLATAHRVLPAVVRDRLLQTKKIAAAVVEAINIESHLTPARVMFIPASFGLLGTLASVTLSGLLAMYQSLRSAL